MTTFPLELPRVRPFLFRRFRYRTPRETLAMLGIPELPKKLVRQHKKKELAYEHSGIWKHLWPLAVAYDMMRDFILLFMLLSGVATGLLGIGAAHNRLSDIVFFISAGFLLVSTGLLYLQIFEDKKFYERLVRAAEHWQSFTPKDYGTAIPPVIKERMHKLRPFGGRQRIEATKADPFLVWHPAWWHPKIYIGAWATGV